MTKPPNPAAKKYECSGLPASWPNAWLAAVGCTVLVEGMRLSWTDEADPVAVLSHNDTHPLDALVNHWPTPQRFNKMALAVLFNIKSEAGNPGESVIEVGAFRDAMSDIATPDKRSLSGFYCDQDTEETKNGPACATSWFFHHGKPGATTLKTCLDKVSDGVAKVSDICGLRDSLLQAFNGTPQLDDQQGLAFDGRRKPRNNHPDASEQVSPIVELLSFWGVSVLPLRGQGTAAKNSHSLRPTQRCQSGHVLRYPTWDHASGLDHQAGLDRWGIDALLTHWERLWDRCDNSSTPNGQSLEPLQIRTGWEAETLRPSADNDRARGLHASRINFDANPSATRPRSVRGQPAAIVL